METPMVLKHGNIHQLETDVILDNTPPCPLCNHTTPSEIVVDYPSKQNWYKCAYCETWYNDTGEFEGEIPA